GLASNYALPAFDPGTAPVTITPRMVTAALSASGVDRPYDGTANAAPEFVPVFEFSGLAAGDTGLALSYGSASYDSADVLAATTLTVDGLAIDGVSGTLGSAPSDYALAATTAVAPAAVTPAPLTVTARNDAKFVTQADSPGFEGVRFEGFAPGETAADLGGALAVTRSNAGQEAAGVYADVLVPTGLTSSNYAITFLPGDYTIVPSDQLLIEVADQSHVYGSETPYVLERVSYFDGTGEVRLDDGSVPGAAASVSSGNLVSVDDGVGGAVAFSLSPENAGLSGAGLIPAGSYQVALVGSVSGNSANFSDVITVIGGHDVAPRDLTPSAAGGVRKVYDGTTAMTNVTIDLATPEAGDDVTVSGAGAFSDPDAGTGKTYTVSGVTLSGADAANYRLSSGASFSGNDGVITPRTLLVTWAGVDRVYDGTADASVTTTDDRKSGDDLTIARSASFADKNAGTDRPVSITGVGLSGADAGNYVVAPTGATTASITRLDSVNWVGGPSGDWFDPDNWTDGAVPDLSNVAAVIIPAGVRVTFGTSVVPPAEPGPVNVESLGTAGTLVQTGGTLNVWSGGVTLEGYEQSGGTLGVAGDARLGSFTRTGGNADILGDLAVSGTLEQTGGRLAVTGSVDAGTLVQTGGDAGVGGDLNVTGGLEQADGALAVSGDVSAGSLSQTGGDADIGGDLDVARGFDQTGPGTIRIAGRADLTDGAGGMSIGNLTVGGGLAATSTGGPIVQEPGTTILVAGTTDLAAATGGVPADIDLGGPRNDFGGPLTARAGGLFIRDVDDLTLGNVSASGAVSVAAGGDIRLTSDIAANAVTFESLTGSVLQSGGVLTVAAGPSAVVAPVSVILTQPGNVLGGGLTVTSPLSQVTGDVSSTTAAAVVGAVAATGTARLSPPDSADLPAEIALPGTAVPGGPGAAPDAEGLPGGVRVLSMPAIGAGEAARMLVLLDEAALGGGAPLRFGLSPEARAALDADAVLRARREDGSPLPSWLVFDGRTGEFTVNEEALSDLPGDVIVTDGRTSVALRIDLGGT
ncbi:MAG: YDG domain-containing protein, partial [Roseicyclus sp.]